MILSCSLIFSQDHRNWMHSKMCLVRTYFLCHIVNGEERRYTVDSSVTSCLKVLHCLTKICLCSTPIISFSLASEDAATRPQACR